MDGTSVTFNCYTAMKKAFLTLGAAFLALVACNKVAEQHEPVVEPEVIEQEGAVLSFTSDRPQTEADTKTAWDSENSAIVWTTGDRIKVGYTLDGVWMAKDDAADLSSEPKVPAKFYVSNNVDIDATHANLGTFSVPTSFTNSPSGNAVFYGVYPQTCTDTDSNYAPSLVVNIKPSQTPGANTFDKDADIMVGQTEVQTLTGSFPTSPMEMVWNRIVAHADITFKNLGIVDDTSVDKITMTFNSEAKVVGSIYVDVTDGAVTNTSSALNTLELKGTNLSLSGTNIEAWVCVLPTDFSSVNVVVKTDKATYTRSITGLDKSFKKNARNTLGINMASATREVNTNVLDNGNYVLAVKSGDDYYAISSAANGTSARRDEVQITTIGFDPTDYSVITPYTAANNLIWTITNVTGGVKINVAGDTNSYMKYGSNTLPLGSSEAAIFDVAEDSGTYIFENNNRYISRNTGIGFGCYGSGSYLKNFYVIPATGTPTISFAETSKNVTSDATSTAFTYTTLFLASEPTVTVTSDEGSAVSSTSIADGTLTVNLNANTTSSSKTVILTVSATGASDVVLTITQAGVVPDASNGDTLWAEAFTGFSANDVPIASNASTTVYSDRSVTYACTFSGTKVYNNNTAGGVSPELLIAKNGGTFSVTGIPTGNATEMTLSFKSNNGCTVSSNTTDAVIGSRFGTGNNYCFAVTVPSGTKTINLTFTNFDTENNTRVDDFSLVVGAPVASITVVTNDATSTESALGATATVNGTITLVNGAVIGDVNEAGFYYKLTSADSFTKVTLDSAPTTTSFSYDLTGLTKDAEYTFKAYAIYDGGGEVEGETLTFTPTKSGGGSLKAIITYENFTNTSYNTSENTFTQDTFTFGYVNAMRNGSNGTPSGWAKNQVIQTKNGSSIYNKSSMGKIKKIRVYTVANTNSFTITSGSTENPDSNSVTRPSTPTGTESVTYSKYENKTVTEGQTTTANYYDFTISDQKYFTITPGGSVYIYKIEITYSN